MHRAISASLFLLILINLILGLAPKIGSILEIPANYEAFLQSGAGAVQVYTWPVRSLPRSPYSSLSLHFLLSLSTEYIGDLISTNLVCILYGVHTYSNSQDQDRAVARPTIPPIITRLHGSCWMGITEYDTLHSVLRMYFLHIGIVVDDGDAEY